MEIQFLSKRDNLYRKEFFVGSVLLCLSALFLLKNNRVLFWGPKDVPQQMIFADSLALSMARVVASVTISFILSLIIATSLFHLKPKITKMFFILLLLFAITPPTIWSTIVVMLVGLGSFSSIITIVVSTLFLLTAVNLYLMQQIPGRRFNIATVYQMGLWDRIKYVLLPEIRSGLLFSLRINFLVSWLALITAESSGISTGLGALLLFGRQMFDWEIVISSWFAIIGGAVVTDVVATGGVQFLNFMTRAKFGENKQC